MGMRKCSSHIGALEKISLGGCADEAHFEFGDPRSNFEVINAVMVLQLSPATVCFHV